MTLDEGTIIGDDFRIDSVIAAGGMGVVYRATDLQLKRTVAIKFISPAYANDEQFRRRFQQEARIAAGLNDLAHVVATHRLGDYGECLYVVMEYIDGPNLGAEIVHRGRLAPARAVAVIAQIADALDKAHVRGVVHRDVTPMNILLASHNGEDNAYLTDFGVAKWMVSQSRLTQLGEVAGTSDYMSPEQINGGPPDPRMDVYALGCVLFQALTGDVVYPRVNRDAVLIAHADPNQSPPRVTDRVSDLPPALNDVIARALAKDPARRFASAGELARAAALAVKKHVGNGDVTRTAAIWKAITRHPYRALAVIAALAAVAAAIFIPGMGDQSLRIYSSLPLPEQQEMENAMQLALEEDDHKAGRFRVSYEALDDTPEAGQTAAAKVRANAMKAVNDPNTAVYIGNYNSGDTQVSLPILNKARIPQISPASTRTGLTIWDPRGDRGEPERYQPSGYRNFVRIIPTSKYVARALLTVMKPYGDDGCRTAVMINDDGPYGEDLANNIRKENDEHRVVRFRFAQSVGPDARYAYLVDRAFAIKPDCFVYSGTVHPNTVAMFTEFAHRLPDVKLYGTGIATQSFYDPSEGGIRPDVAKRVTLMVPPIVGDRSQAFYEVYKKRFRTPKDPGPYAIYGYEAMKLALAAIAQSGTGKRQDIRHVLLGIDQLHAMDRSDGSIGSYQITSKGDTTFRCYGVSKIQNGTLVSRKAVPKDCKAGPLRGSSPAGP